jgi:hypothetical protein
MRNKLFTISAFAFFFVLPAISQAATRIDDPAKFVSGVYKMMAAKTDYIPPDDIYTPHLASLFALEKKDSSGEVGRLDFDIWTGTQDWELKNVSVTEQAVDGSNARKIVIAKFKNIGTSEEMHFYFEKSGSGWLLDDIRSAKDQMWTLSLVLKYGWDSGN